MKRICLAIAVLLQSAEGLSAAPDVTQQPGAGAATHLGLSAASLAKPAEPLRALGVGTLRAGAPEPGARDAARRGMPRWARGRLAIAGYEALLFAPHAFHPLHAEMPAVQRVAIWGSRRGFHTLRASIAVALEGGAGMREQLSLTAGFRLLGYGPGAAAQLEGAKLDTGIAAPFLGLALRF